MPPAPESTTQRMAITARHIEAHSDECLSLNDLGQIAGLSAARLQRVFKSVFGVSPKAYQSAARRGGNGEQVVYACRQTVVGWLMMAATERGP